MSIIPRSSLHFTVAALLSLSGVAAVSPFAKAEEEGIYGTQLWDATFPLGQWRSFGLGVLDSRVVEGSNGGGGGLSIDVDWGGSTFGTGAVFEKGEGGGMALPSLAGIRTIAFEARYTGEEARTVTLECVIRSSGKAYRASPEAAKPLASDWATYEFTLPDDFPRLEAVLTEIDALRILFPRNESSGRGRVEFRNVRLLP